MSVTTFGTNSDSRNSTTSAMRRRLKPSFSRLETLQDNYHDLQQQKRELDKRYSQAITELQIAKGGAIAESTEPAASRQFARIIR
jgi:hypothetical protein